MKKKAIRVCVLLLFGIVISCASMNLDVQTLRGPAYGSFAPRITLEKMKAFRKEPPWPYIVVAEYVVQETPLVMMAQDANTMLQHVGRLAHEKGADAIILDSFNSAQATGGYARTTAVVKVRGIRFVGDMPY